MSRKQPVVRNVAIGDGTVRVAILGGGRPVLFLHGISAHARAWRPVAERFAEEHPGWECWLPDLPGRGASDARAELSYTLDDEVRRLRAVVRALAPDGPRPRLVAGHSQGAAIALALAEAEPDIGGLLLSNPVTPEIRSPAILRLLRSAAVRRAVGSLLAPLHAPLGHLVLRRACGPAFRAPSGAGRRLRAALGEPGARPHPPAHPGRLAPGGTGGPHAPAPDRRARRDRRARPENPGRSREAPRRPPRLRLHRVTRRRPRPHRTAPPPPDPPPRRTRHRTEPLGALLHQAAERFVFPATSR